MHSNFVHPGADYDFSGQFSSNMLMQVNVVIDDLSLLHTFHSISFSDSAKHKKKLRPNLITICRVMLIFYPSVGSRQ
jgi:hypothetical protein